MRKKIKAIAFFVYSIELNLTSAFTMLAITVKQASPFSKRRQRRITWQLVLQAV